MTLENRFIALLNTYTANKVLVASLWNNIELHYSEKHRAYHNLNHLTEIFTYFDTYKNQLETPNTVAFSIFYHDIIYSVWNKNNEEKSAQFAIKKLTTILSKSQLSEIYNQILATKTHSANNNDTKWFIDFDLAILGQTENTYIQYTELIRKEYKIIPFPIYKKGRTKILKHFCDKPFIFATNTFRKLYDEKAKQNLHTELKSL